MCVQVQLQGLKLQPGPKRQRLSDIYEAFKAFWWVKNTSLWAFKSPPCGCYFAVWSSKSAQKHNKGPIFLHQCAHFNPVEDLALQVWWVVYFLGGKKKATLLNFGLFPLQSDPLWTSFQPFLSELCILKTLLASVILLFVRVTLHKNITKVPKRDANGQQMFFLYFHLMRFYSAQTTTSTSTTTRIVCAVCGDLVAVQPDRTHSHCSHFFL